MRSTDSFSSYHPIINFLYFGLVLVFSMFFMDPVCLAVSLTASLVYLFRLRGRGKAGRVFRYVIPVMLLAAVINPAFNHRGVTILAYLPSGNPLTLESILYGLAAAAMLASVLVWFACFSDVVTSDKFIYLFGRIIPALSLVLSMTLRFVPRFTAQMKAVSEARKSLCPETSGKLIPRIRNAVAVLSSVVTWSLENSIDTADSMRSRGYGLSGRTAYSVYRFDRRDRSALIWLVLCGAVTISGWIAGAFSFDYYPALGGAAPTALDMSFTLVYLALCLTPVFMDIREDRAWKRS
jgi:energy-coupling factor transport system permease protein